MEVREMMRELKRRFPDDILDHYPVPSQWCENRNDVKAILLGCDPSNRHTHCMPYVFTLGMDLPVFNSFKQAFEKDLKCVGLSWNTIYVQNLCRNYFRKETSSNKKIWKEAAKSWIPLLKEELTIFHKQIPVLLTSDILFEVLVPKTNKYGPTLDFYECKQPIPIPCEYNALERPLIPFYRGTNGRTKQSYRLATGNWEEYRFRIKSLLSSLS